MCVQQFWAFRGNHTFCDKVDSGVLLDTGRHQPGFQKIYELVPLNSELPMIVKKISGFLDIWWLLSREFQLIECSLRSCQCKSCVVQAAKLHQKATKECYLYNTQGHPGRQKCWHQPGCVHISSVCYACPQPGLWWRNSGFRLHLFPAPLRASQCVLPCRRQGWRVMRTLQLSLVDNEPLSPSH